MSSVLNAVTSYAPQTDIKTTPTTGWKNLPNISNGLNTTSSLAESEILNGGRIQSSGMVTGGEIAGEISSELMFSTFDDLIAAAFWNDWTVAVPDTTPSQLTIGDKRKIFAFTKDFAAAKAFYLWLGVHVNTFSLEVTTDSLVKIGFGLMGLGYQSQKTASFAKNPTPSVDGLKASGQSIGDILMDGKAIGVCVESFSLELDNQSEVQKCLGKNLYGGNIQPLIANISGSIGLAFNEKTYDILELQRTGAVMSLEIPIRFADGTGYDIVLPELQIEGEIPSPTGSELITAEVTYKVVNKSPIIKRIEA